MKANLEKIFTHKKSILLITFLLVISIAVFLTVYISREIYLRNNPLERNEFKFTTYIPTKLPKDVAIRKKYLSVKVSTPPLFKPNVPTLRLELTDDPVLDSIYESKYLEEDSEQLLCKTTAESSCSAEQTTPKGQKYVLSLGYSDEKKNKVDSVRVDIVKNNTYIVIENEVFATRQWTKEEWDALIDSLEPVELKNVPIKYWDGNA